jgi:hypothetical protein
VIAPLVAIVERLTRPVIRWGIALVRDHLGVFVALAALVALGWIIAGRGLRGRRLLLWQLVPLLAAAALACLVGPDRLFPKDPYEGPILLGLSENHAVTLLDLPAAALGGAAVALGVWSVGERWRGQGG